MVDENPVPLPTCPMAETCKGMMGRPFSGVALLIPGLLLIGLGILVVVEPRLVGWIMAAAFILMGVMMLLMAHFIRNVGTRFQKANRSKGK